MGLDGYIIGLVRCCDREFNCGAHTHRTPVIDTRRGVLFAALAPQPHQLKRAAH